MNNKEKVNKESEYIYNNYLNNFKFEPIKDLRLDNFLKEFEVKYKNKNYKLSKDIFSIIRLIPIDEFDDMIKFHGGNSGFTFSIIQKQDSNLEYMHYNIMLEEDELISKLECSIVDDSNNELSKLFMNKEFDYNLINSVFNKRITSTICTDKGNIYGFVLDGNPSLKEYFDIWKNIRDYQINYDESVSFLENNMLLIKNKNKTK